MVIKNTTKPSPEQLRRGSAFDHIKCHRQVWNTWGGRGSQDVRKGIRIGRKPLKTAKKCRENIAVVLCLLRRSFCTPALKYKNAQIVRSLRHTQGPVIFFIKFLLHFSSLWVLSFVILTEKAVEYSDHVLVREIKGEDKGALELLT